MYNYLRGKIEYNPDGVMTVDVGGVGYEVTVSSFAASKLGRAGEIQKVLVYLAVKEDEMKLYGFYSVPEKNMFLRLITISGIGPKAAMSVLSGIPLDELTFSIINGNTSNINKIKGIGKKTAERIVLELRDKLESEFAGGESGGEADSSGGVLEDAVLALISLGLTKAEAAQAVKKAGKPGQTLEETVMLALKGQRV